MTVNIPAGKWIVLIEIALIAVVVVGVGGYLSLQELTLPMYELRQEAPVDGFGVTTLRRGDELYVSGATEFPLFEHEATWGPRFGGRLGKTADGGLHIDQINGQAGTDYLLAHGDMTGDSIFRKATREPLPLGKLQVNAIEYVTNKNGSRVVKRSEDGRLIEEIVSALRSDVEGKKPEPNFSAQIYQLNLFSAQLPGLAYLAYVVLDSDGSIYLAERGFESESWLATSDTIARWVREE